MSNTNNQTKLDNIRTWYVVSSCIKKKYIKYYFYYLKKKLIIVWFNFTETNANNVYKMEIEFNILQKNG